MFEKFKLNIMFNVIKMDTSTTPVSVIIPIHNAELWLNDCLKSVLNQTFNQPIEVCVYDDASTDKSLEIVESFNKQFVKRNVTLLTFRSNPGENRQPKGCGYAKNQAVALSKGEYLCFLDADDVMHCERINMQYQAALKLPKFTLIGSQVVRDPPESTVRYTSWINNLSPSQLYTQIYTSHGPTVVMPTWFCHRSVFYAVGGFNQTAKGVPEDYLFFLKFLELGGSLFRVDKPLMIYRHHPNATTFSVLEKTIWDIRINELQKNILSKWKSFTIWNAGKQGRRFYRDISDINRAKVKCFCDVDLKKISKGFYTYEMDRSSIKTKVPIVHFKNAECPFVICVKLGLTAGAFETNLSSLNLQEGLDYILFS